MQGPSTLPEILEILKPMVQRLVKMWRQTHPGMTQLRGQSWRKVLVTTSYSGIDFPGTALAMIIAYLRELGISLDVQFYSACDVDPQCQKGLMNKKPEMGKPEHVFDTLLGHFPEDLIQTLLSAAKAAREHVGQVVRATESKYGKKAARRRRSELVVKLGTRFVDWMRGRLSQVGVNSHRWCVRHQMMCPSQPPRDGSSLHLEIAGSTCVAFSKMCHNCKSRVMSVVCPFSRAVLQALHFHVTIGLAVPVASHGAASLVRARVQEPDPVGVVGRQRCCVHCVEFLVQVG
jgi:hypothetical protein